MKRLLASLACFAFAACASPSPQAAMDRVSREFAGRDIDDFFVSYGSAFSSKPAKEGGTSYRWISLEPNGGPAPPSILTYPGGNFGPIGDASNGEIVGGYCEIRILTDARDKIRELALVSDSTGKFSGSRCAEIFGQPPK